MSKKMKLIDQQAAINAVDVRNLHRGIVDALQDIISELPTADAVEVVRCNDCRFFKGDGLECYHSGMFAYEDDFCSRGERRER